MSKTRPFSIYLLKSDFDALNSLIQNHGLKKDTSPALPAGSSIYILDGIPTDPWWKNYFQIDRELKQSSKGALVFLPVGDRVFALSFGHVYHNLKDEAYEHDFGLKVTLNCVDPNELKSTDTLEPGAARRQRTQLPVGSDLTYFDFDQDTSILKNLTGKVLDAYKSLFANVTGSSSLVVKSEVPVNRLVSFCEDLLALYRKEDYRTTFPEIENVIPISDPATCDLLNKKLVDGLRTKSPNIYLTIPDLIDYRQVGYFAEFAGVGTSLQYPDVFVNKYYEYLESHGRPVEDITFAQLSAHRLKLTDSDGKPQKSYSLLNCLIFDTSLDDGTQTFHLTEGEWYRVENSYIAKLKAAIDPLCFDIGLPCYVHKDEDHYNTDVAADRSFLCLHKSSIAPHGQRGIEPCDLYTVEGDTAVFYHIKRSTVSMLLNHLFSQGVNSIELIKGEPTCLKKLKNIIEERSDQAETEQLLAPLDNGRLRVVFGVVTHKDQYKKSENLPLFSRVSLMRVEKRLRMYSTECRLGFIKAQPEDSTGIKKKRKSRSSSAVPVA